MSGLVLVRHGESEGNVAGVLLGRLDSPLTGLGERQAAATGRHLAASGYRPDVICSSPLARARRSAEIIAGELAALGPTPEIAIEPRLVELDYGELDGTSLAGLDPADRARWRADAGFRPPGGETLEELQQRVSQWCDAIASLEGDVLAVSHVSPIKAAAIWSMSLGAALSWKMSLRISTITRISLRPRALVSFGEAGHLVGVS